MTKRRRQPEAIRKPDPRYASIRVDSHFFDNHIDADQRAAADQLIELAEKLEILIAVPHSVRKELDHPSTPAHTRAQAARLPYTMDTGMGQARNLAVVQRIMRGNALPGKHAKDAAHIYDAALWQCSYFVTCDKRIIAKQSELNEAIDGLWVLKPTEMLEIYAEFSRSSLDATE